MGGKALVLAASDVLRLAHRGRAVRRLVRGAEGATGAGGQTLLHSLRVAVESVGVEEALAASGKEDGSGTTGTETGKGIGIGVHRYPEESRRLHVRRGVTEIARRRGDGHHPGLVRVHHHVAGGNFCLNFCVGVQSVCYLKFN